MSVKSNSIAKYRYMIMTFVILCIVLLGARGTVKAAEEDEKSRDHTHVFNIHYAQNAGYTVAAPHDFVYGYNAFNEPVMKTCYSYIIHTYYVMGCNCGTMYPIPGSHEHESGKQHPMTADPKDCKMGYVSFTIPTLPSCYPSDY